jgi:hypothetical protein
MKFIFKTGTIALLLFGLSGTTDSQQFLKHRDAIHLVNWKFHKGDVNSAESRTMTFSPNWEDVAVPHTWNARDVLTDGPEYYQGVGWYRTVFELPRDGENERTFIRFEGVCLVADVFVNGIYLGNHKGGYSAFCFEITPYVLAGEENTVSVRVDNAVRPDVAPSGTYLYPLFGGIYRPVVIFSTRGLCVSPLDYASSGVYIRPKRISSKEADLEVETLLDYRSYPRIQTRSSELLPPGGMNGRGLVGEYFDNPEFKGEPRHARIDDQVNFNYGKGGPFADMPVDNFSVRWSGRFIPRKSGVYQFVMKSDDGSRLFFDDKPIINHWGAHAATEKSYEIMLAAGREVRIRIEYNELSLDASVMFGWTFLEPRERPVEAGIETLVYDKEGKTVARKKEKTLIKKHGQTSLTQRIHIDVPRLWDAKTDPYLYTLDVRIVDMRGNRLDEVEQPLGLRFFKVDGEKGLILNGRPFPLYGVARHQEWEGVGSALTDRQHESDVDMIMELGATGVRLAHYQQAEKMYSLCDEKGLVVWAEIPNTPAYRAENPSYLDNCKNQLVELIKQNFNHPSIFFWGLYNEVDIPASDVKNLNDAAKRIDPFRLTTQADLTDDATERHGVTDVVCWNKYFGWYYGDFKDYADWFDRLHRDHPELKIGLSEYGAGGCVSQQKENPERPDPTNGRFFPEQYQRLYHERVWSILKDRKDIWCKFIWNMFDFSWTNVKRGDRDFMNHKGLVTHDRKVKKDAFYFYKANWSNEPLLYILSRRNSVRKDVLVPVEVYTNLDAVELYVDGALVSRKKMESDIHKITWENIRLSPGRNSICVIGFKDDKKFADACEWTYCPE